MSWTQRPIAHKHNRPLKKHTQTSEFNQSVNKSVT